MDIWSVIQNGCILRYTPLAYERSFLYNKIISTDFKVSVSPIRVKWFSGDKQLMDNIFLYLPMYELEISNLIHFIDDCLTINVKYYEAHEGSNLYFYKRILNQFHLMERSMERGMTIYSREEQKGSSLLTISMPIKH